MKPQHSDILIHWTSKDLAEKPLDDPTIRESYVALLRSIYSKGLRFSIPKNPDVVVGINGPTKIPTKPIICFTELRLSQTQEHASQYGGLGIGFRREFLMTWGANPVFYMQSKNQGVVNTNLSGLALLQNKPDGLDIFLSYIKPMGEPYRDQYSYFDEFEWRMVSCMLGGQLPKRYVESEGDIYFHFYPDEVLLLSLPNETIRKQCLNDHQLREMFKQHMPMMVDTSNCQVF
jgi:hypothetical protein